MKLTDYGKPTYRTFERSCDQWKEWKQQAASLPPADIKRHASVSTSNNHFCVECFCCACVTVAEECGY